jgi:hypothetical protein
VKVLAGLVVAMVAFMAMVVIGVGLLGVAGSLSEEPASPTGTSPRADYDPVRLPAGLIAAALSLGSAAVLVRRTDWSAVGEAAAPQIDDAEYADLDAIVAGLAPE